MTATPRHHASLVLQGHTRTKGWSASRVLPDSFHSGSKTTASYVQPVSFDPAQLRLVKRALLDSPQCRGRTVRANSLPLWRG